MPRGIIERGSWQIHVVALISQRPHLQYLTANVSGITPVKKVEILHLSTLYGHACFSLSCPCDRTMFDSILVLSSYFAVFFVSVSGVTCWCAATGSVLLLFQCEFRPSWQVNVSVIVCILIDWVISLLPRDRFERWSWQIPVVAIISQLPNLQYLTTNVFLIAPARRVENHGSPWLVFGNSSVPVHALLPQWCVPVRWLRIGTSTYW